MRLEFLKKNKKRPYEALKACKMLMMLQQQEHEFTAVNKTFFLKCKQCLLNENSHIIYLSALNLEKISVEGRHKSTSNSVTSFTLSLFVCFKQPHVRAVSCHGSIVLHFGLDRQFSE